MSSWILLGLFLASAPADPVPVDAPALAEAADAGMVDAGVVADPAPGPIALADAGIAIPPPPEGMGGKQRLTEEDYLRKNERGYFTGLPLANYDPNTGFGFGARGYYFYNGTREDRFFAYTPYRH